MDRGSLIALQPLMIASLLSRNDGLRGHVARARGMAQLAKDSGLGREGLYKALTPGAKPRYDTMLKLLHALGV
jgi:probable addiction module antidote protein